MDNWSITIKYIFYTDEKYLKYLFNHKRKLFVSNMFIYYSPHFW